MTSEAELKDAVARAWVVGGSPDTIMVSPINHAMITAYREFEGRNWRRIKREVNKAAKRARLALLRH